MHRSSRRGNRALVAVILGIGGLFAVALWCNQAHAQIPPPPSPPRMPGGIHGGGISGRPGISGGISGRPGISGGISGHPGNIHGGGISGRPGMSGMSGIGGSEWVFSCSNCDRELGRGRSRSDGDRITRCPFCGTQFTSGAGSLFALAPTGGGSPGSGGGGLGLPSFNFWNSGSLGGWEDYLLYVIGGLVAVAVVFGGVVGVLTLMNRRAMRKMEMEYET